MRNKFINAVLISLVFAATSLTANATIIRVDIGVQGQDIQSDGFEELNGFNGTFSGIDVALSGIGTKGFRNRNDVTNILGDLTEDFFFATNSITLTFDNLTAGNYSFTSWHHDRDYTQSFLNINSSGTDVLNFQASTGHNPLSIASGTILFTSDGVGSDTIQFTTSSKVRGGASAVILSGFTVQSVPEPTTLAIFALGIIGLASRRLKK